MNSFDEDKGSEIIAGYIVLFMMTIPLALTAIFVILKVFELISWSWFWVFSPITIPATIVLFALVVTSADAIFNSDKFI